MYGNPIHVQLFIYFQRNAQSINQWLVINSIFFVFFLLFIGFTTVKNASPDIIPIGIPVSSMYQIFTYTILR